MDTSLSATKEDRAKLANRLIEIIGNHGRKFFNYKGNRSRFEIDHRGRIWYIDQYTHMRIYTHYRAGRWRGFTNGGTLKALIQSLCDFIQTGQMIIGLYTFGPWHDSLCGGDLWGYGKDMEKVREAAAALGISTTTREEEKL